MSYELRERLASGRSLRGFSGSVFSQNAFGTRFKKLCTGGTTKLYPGYRFLFRLEQKPVPRVQDSAPPVHSFLNEVPDTIIQKNPGEKPLKDLPDPCASWGARWPRSTLESPLGIELACGKVFSPSCRNLVAKILYSGFRQCAGPPRFLCSSPR